MAPLIPPTNTICFQVLGIFSFANLVVAPSIGYIVAEL